MKKILSMAAIALFIAMTSCSGDDSPESTNPDTSSVFLTKIESTYDDGSSESSLFTYEGNKLIKEDYTDGGYALYEYSNSHISQILYYIDEEELFRKEIYEYNSENKLASYTHQILIPTTYISERIEFTHVDNNTVIAKNYNINNTLISTDTITISNGNITQYISEHNSGSVTNSFTYDDKNDPFKNIHDFDVIILSQYHYGGGVNNVITENLENVNGNTYTYTYNANGFPSISFRGGVTIQYFYE